MVPRFGPWFHDHKLPGFWQSFKRGCGEGLRNKSKWLEQYGRVQYHLKTPTQPPGGADLYLIVSWPQALLWKDAPTPENIFFLRQGLDQWSGAAQGPKTSWKIHFAGAVISQWLQDQMKTIEPQSYPVPIVPLGIDDGFFINTIRDYQRLRVLLFRHPAKEEQYQEALRWIKQAKSAGIEFEIKELHSGRFNEDSHQTGLGQLFMETDFLLYPSQNDGWAMLVTEAMAAGVIPIAYPVGFLHDYGKPLENYLLLDQDSWMEPLRQPETLAKISLAGQELTRTFTWLDTAKKLVAVWQRT